MKASVVLIKQFLHFILISLISFICSFNLDAKTFPHNVNDIAYSKKLDQIFALVSDTDPMYGNCLVQLNSESLEVERSLFVGSRPLKMELTGDENYLWVSFYGTGYLKRIKIETFEIDRDIFLGPIRSKYNGNYANLLANYFTCLPDHNDKVIVNTTKPFIIFDVEDTYLFEFGERKKEYLGEDILSLYDPNCFVPISNGNRVLGTKGSALSHRQDVRLTVIDILPEGLSFNSYFNTSLSVYGGRFKALGDTIFYSFGSVIDASDIFNIRIIGLFEHDNISSDFGYIYSSIHKAFIYPNFRKGVFCLTHYDINTYEPIQEYPINFSPEFAASIDYVRDIEVMSDKKYCLRFQTKKGELLLAVVNSYPLSDESIDSDKISVFPNPATTRLYISKTSSSAEYFIYNIYGELISSGEVNTNNYIDVSIFPLGVYLLQMKTNQSSFQKTFIKM